MDPRMPCCRRDGAALALAIVIIVLVEVVVAATLHLAVTEVIVAGREELLVRLRLAAESGTHAAAAAWHPGRDSLQHGRAAEASLFAEGGFTVNVRVERLEGWLFRFHATASAPEVHGAAAASLLVIAPALANGADVTGPAVAARHLDVGTSGRVIAEDGPCNDTPALAVRLYGSAQPLTEPGAVLHGGVLHDPDAGSTFADPGRVAVVVSTLARPAGAAAGEPAPEDGLRKLPGGLHLAHGPLRLEDPFDGVLVVDGDLTIATVRVTGLVVATGDVHVEQGASLDGAVHAGGTVRVSGGVVLDACHVRDAVDRAALRRPRAFPGRPAPPAF